MKPLTTVNLGKRSYPIFVERYALENLKEVIERNIENVSSITLLTDPIIYRLYGDKVLETVISESKILVPDGEEAKTWDTASEIIGKLLDENVDRKGLLIALGGGAVGDVAGFVSSIYLRGIKVIQIPTTLLAMVDSSIGGKTAVNHPKGKNLIGSFHQPAAVVIDPNLLQSLPLVEITAGLGEIIKYGVIADKEILDILEKSQEEIISGKSDKISQLIGRCAVIKARYVEKDEHDNLGIRASLNYGHTLGHVVEKLSGIRHGEAVSIGMEYAARIAVNRGLFTESEHHRQLQICKNLELPIKYPKLNPKKILEVMKKDKKAEQGKIRFVLPTGLGSEPVLEVVSENEIRKVLEELP
jgi:3-dehydroquinate synthase